NELILRTNMDRSRPGVFNLLAPTMLAEERRQLADARWLVLTSNFQEKVGSEVKPNEPIMRLGAMDGPPEIELKIPQKHIGQVRKAYDRLKTDELEVDFLLLGETTVPYKGFLHRSRIAGEATPNREDQNDPEPFVLAYARIEGPDIPEGYQV